MDLLREEDRVEQVVEGVAIEAAGEASAALDSVKLVAVAQEGDSEALGAKTADSLDIRDDEVAEHSVPGVDELLVGSGDMEIRAEAGDKLISSDEAVAVECEDAAGGVTVADDAVESGEAEGLEFRERLLGVDLDKDAAEVEDLQLARFVDRK